MGQSYVTGDKSEIEVRDSTLELVLAQLLVELERLPPDDTRDAAHRSVRGWSEYWASMPPGCKELDVRKLAKGLKPLLKVMLARVHDAAQAQSETARVAQQLGTLLEPLGAASAPHQG